MPDFTELKTEIAELKDMLMKLQSFTMETNNKLVNVIFNESPRFELNQDEEEEEEVIGEMNFIELSQGGFNLKEMIQHELCKNMSDMELVSESVSEVVSEVV